MSEAKKDIDQIRELINHLKGILDSAKNPQELPEEVLHELEEGCLSTYKLLVRHRLLKEMLSEKPANSDDEQLPNQLQMDFAAPPVLQKQVEVKHKEDQKVTLKNEGLVEGSNSNKELRIGINDKFRFIKELFEESTQEYTIAINQVNQIDEENEAIRYVDSLKDIYRWKDEDPCYSDFIQLIKQRYE